MKTRLNNKTQQQEEIQDLPVDLERDTSNVSLRNVSLSSNLEMPLSSQVVHDAHYPQLKIIPLPSSQVTPLNLGDTSSKFYQRHNEQKTQSFKTVDSFYDNQLSLPSSGHVKPSTFQSAPSKTGVKLDQIIGDFLAAILKGLLVLFGIKKVDKPINKHTKIKK